MKLYNSAIHWRIARLARRRRLLTVAALNGDLTTADVDFLQPTGLHRLQSMAAAAIPSKQTVFLALAVLAVAALLADPAFAAGSGLEVEQPINKGKDLFINVICPIIGIAGLVMAGVSLISGGARAVGTVAMIGLGVAFVGFAVPMAASAFNLTEGALLPAALLPGGGLW